jgi:hypothetical protein
MAAAASIWLRTKLPKAGRAGLGNSVLRERTRIAPLYQATANKSQLANEHFRNRKPGWIFDHDLPLANAVRQEGDPRGVAVDHPAEGEAPAGTGCENVAVD